MKFRYMNKFEDMSFTIKWYGRKKKCNVDVIFSADYKYWYFLIERTSDHLGHNSLWDGKKYQDVELAKKEAEEWVDHHAN